MSATSQTGTAPSDNEATLNLPSAPKPLYPDVPWWAVLVTAMVFSVVSVIATAVVMSGKVAVPEGALPTLPSVGSLAVDTMVYMPHILLLFGVLADMFTYDGVWSIPSLIGVLSIFVNYIFRYFWLGLASLSETTTKAFTKSSSSTTTGTSSSPSGVNLGIDKGGSRGGAASVFSSSTYDGCSVQGFEDFGSKYAPQTLVVTATVFSYYCFDLIQNRGWVNSIGAITGFLLTYLAQVAIIWTKNDGKGCDVKGDTSEPVGPFSQGIRALVEGLLFGGTSYGIVKTYYPTRLPSSAISPFPRKTSADLTMGADGKMRDADGFPYVVLPNGQAVPDLGDRQARLAFGTMASQNLGTGVPATAADCKT